MRTFRRWSARRRVGALEPGREGKGFPSATATPWQMRGDCVLVELCHGGSGHLLAVSLVCVLSSFSLRLVAWSVPAAMLWVACARWCLCWFFRLFFEVSAFVLSGERLCLLTVRRPTSLGEKTGVFSEGGGEWHDGDDKQGLTKTASPVACLASRHSPAGSASVDGRWF